MFFVVDVHVVYRYVHVYVLVRDAHVHVLVDAIFVKSY